jgi:hypothetical protein
MSTRPSQSSSSSTTLRLHSCRTKQSQALIDKSRRVSFEPEPAEKPYKDTDSELAADQQLHSISDTKDSGDADDDDDDDSSIEVLLTILPPSPKKKSPAKRKRPPETLADENLPANTNAAPRNGIAACARDVFQQHEVDKLGSSPPVAMSLQEAVKMDVAIPPIATDLYMHNVAAKLAGCDSLPANEECSGISDDRISEDAPSGSYVTNDDERKTQPAGTTLGTQEVTSSEPDILGTVASAQPAGYSFVSSAYVQNLAEICNTILEDRRWRVGKNNERLLAWEYGDDLSAVIALARRFRPFTVYSNEKKGPCLGMPWCPCQESDEQNERIGQPVPKRPCASTNCDDYVCTASSSSSPLQENNDYSSSNDEEMSEVQDGTNKERSNSKEGNSISSCADAADDRCLHLYCRLYYRKGPWFRLDEVYMSYYAPKQAKVDRTTNGVAHGSDCGEGVPTKDRRPPARSSASNANWTSISEALFDRQCEALKVFLQDLNRLKKMGLIRCFHDEKECGQTVGTATRLLTVPERNEVLSKLGGGGNKKVTAATLRRSSSMINPEPVRWNRPSPVAREENEIWKQMCRQKSISSQFFKPNDIADQTENGSVSKEAGSLLPVLKHVNQLIFDRLASRVIEEGCATSRTIAKKRRVKVAVAEAIAACQQLASPRGPQVEVLLGSFGACIRLREDPLIALQRCARLFLCATAGPGQMRGGTNGWQLVPELHRHRVLQHTDLKDAPWAMKVIGDHSWHNVAYPGLQHRFGILAPSCFARAYTPLLQGNRLSMNCEEDYSMEHVFVSRRTFLCWEVSAELRATVDFLTEVNELVLYNGRRRARDEGSTKEETQDIVVDDAEVDGQKMSFAARGSADFLGLLTPGGRKELVMVFAGSVEADQLSDVLLDVERDATQLFVGAEESNRSPLKTEFEKILCAMAVVIKHILILRIGSISVPELQATVSRPWLRHLSYEGCLSYILWDIIPIFERRRFHSFAFQALELLIHGRCSRLSGPGLQVSRGALDQLGIFSSDGEESKAASFAQILLSRRARGKAFDRLVVDAGHILRGEQKLKGGTQEGTKKTGKRKQPSGSSQRDVVAYFCSEALHNVVANASISFASIRALARRIKTPLAKTLESMPPCKEAEELGLRLACSDESGRLEDQPKRYCDWVPITDHAVANSIAADESSVGRRCSFVGHEDDQKGWMNSSSLNVEQLAMEFYASGRLPASIGTDELKGGYKGWHDEGGMLRALFRVLSFDVLGMDWGCCQHLATAEILSSERSTIHLSRYQGAPFDLHVGYELVDPMHVSETTRVCRGFYSRRRQKIENFLSALESMSPQQASDVVWDSIAARRNFMVKRFRKDPSIDKDILQCRTLSMVAAGFGGKMMAAMFRCFFFDYRHYSGGLPDLLLVRAVQKGVGRATLVDLGEWVGEGFDAQFVAALEAQQRASLLWDRDDDFLGCAKVGDSGARQGSRSRSSGTRQPTRNKDNASNRSTCSTSIPELPPKLHLIHQGEMVEVECMFVEVKSRNDRLDARQEDWLNILDRYGNARVCKFVDGKEKPEKKTNKNGEKGEDQRGKRP